jgi:integrase
VRWRALDVKRSVELRKAGVMEDGEEIRFIVHRMHDGQPLAGKIRSAWEGILEDAALDEEVVRHTLRHTAATWLMQRGVPIWEAAGFLGMSPEILQATYGHHHPDYLQGAAAAIGQKGRVVSVVGLTERENQRKKPNERPET